MDESAILDQESSTILGLTWLTRADILKYNMLPGDILKCPSKRTILSVISKFFDPLGKLWAIKLD